VSHNGERWLPSVLAGIAEQTEPVAGIVAVDTTSRDGSVDLVREALGREPVILPGATSYPDAVDAGLAALSEDAAQAEWIWLLHDDSRPAPDALEQLLRAAQERPEAAILGPKLREWPSLRRLLELGVTISGTGRRETGLERGEYDQGQHDDVREVLAVNTAGMLVRRAVLEQLNGLDSALPIFGNDIDFCWRAAKAGHRTFVVPQSVVFHAEAAHRGTRRTPLTGRHIHYQERRAALYTLLVNSSSRALPWQLLRLGVGTILRMVGLMLLRQVGQALDELAALVSLYGKPGQIMSARRRRRRMAAVSSQDSTTPPGLLAPWWLPYRHGLDVVGDLAAAVTNQAGDVAERRRIAAGTVGPESDPDSDEAWTDEQSLVTRFFTNPFALLATLFVLLALVGAREGFGSVSGGGLSPVPDAARDWWALHLTSWHALGTGTDVPAPPYVLPLALVASFLGTGATISALLVLAVPFSFWGGWRFLRVVARLVAPGGAHRWLLLWGAATYALIPAASGAWGEGRFGIVAVTTLLPWLAHAALGFADPEADRRWRAAFRVGLLLTLAAAFAPLTWWFALVLGVLVVGAAFWISRRLMSDPSVWGPPATAVGLVPVLLSPWWLPALWTGAGQALFLDAGRLPMTTIGYADLLTGHVGDAGAPWWLGVAVLAAAVAALIPSRTRIPVIVCWIVALAAAIVALVLGHLTLHLPVINTSPGLGFLVLALQAAFVTAAVIGAVGFAVSVAAGWRRAVALVVAVAFGLVPLLGLGWFVVNGPGELKQREDSGVPAYMAQEAATSPARGILVLRGSVEEGMRYSVVRGDGTRLGEDEILGLSSPAPSLTADLRDLVAGPADGVARRLAQAGIEYVVLPAPADGRIAAVLDATSGLSQASAESRATRAWQVGPAVDPEAVAGPRSWPRIALLAVQGLGLVVAAVLAAPTVRAGRRTEEST
jgi:GT2 family glycosyltransferase